MNVWVTNDSTTIKGDDTFTLSIFNTWHVTKSANCRRTFADGGNYNTPLVCADLQGFGPNTSGSGPAAMVLMESITLINSVSLTHPALRQDVMKKGEIS
jgi:hypothetical protein